MKKLSLRKWQKGIQMAIFSKEEPEKKLVAASEKTMITYKLENVTPSPQPSADKRPTKRSKKRRLYTLTLLIRRTIRYFYAFTNWLNANRDIFLLLSLVIFSALAGYVLAFIRLSFSLKEIAVGIWDFLWLMGSISAGFLAFVARLYIPAETELSKEIKKSDTELDDSCRTIC